MRASLTVPASPAKLPVVLILRSPAEHGVSKDGFGSGQPLQGARPWCMLRDTDRERSVPQHDGFGGDTTAPAGDDSQKESP
jgi:hypothetical protein